MTAARRVADRSSPRARAFTTGFALPLALAVLAEPAAAAGRGEQADSAQNAAGDGDPLTTFCALPALKKAMVVSTAIHRLEGLDDAALRRILTARAPTAGLPKAEPPPIYDPKKWAPVAPERTMVAAGTPHHRSVRGEVPAIELLPDLHKEVVYDWGTGRIARQGPLSYEQLYENLLHGYPPGADAAVAGVLAALDKNPKMRKLADFFGHAYVDRDGRVFEGITLYEAWYSGEIIEMPDVDAIAFAVLVLDDDSFVSPIPGDARRDALYETMKEKALAYRKYRTMLEAAAAARVRAEPIMDEMYARLVPRFHMVFKACGDDVGRVAKLLGDLNGDREQLIKLVDTAVRMNPEAFADREGRKQELAEMAARVRAVAVAALE